MPSVAASTSAQERKQSILPLFPLLASHDHITRLDASYTLLNSLPLPVPAPNDPDTPYAIRRLIAGLASSNESARQGFAVALSQLVAILPDELAQKVLPQLNEATTSRAGTDAREERELLFAKLVGSHALIRSGVLVRPTGSASNGGEAWKEVVLGLVGLGNRKSWIKEPAYWVVCEALKALLEAQDSDWKEETIKWAVQRLVNDAREKAKGWGPDKLAIVLVLQAYGVDADFKSILAPTFPSGSLLAKSSLHSLAAALRGALTSSPNPFESSSSSKPRQGSNAVKTSKNASAPAPGQNPHFAWNMILGSYFPQEGQKTIATADKASWADFWRVCVDDSLFGSPSLPLKALGFTLLQSTLSHLPPSDLTTLFGPSTLRVFANHLRKSTSHGNEEKTLSRVADKLASSVLPTYLSTHPSASLPLLKVLTSPPNSHPAAFEHKFLEKIVSRLPLSGVKGWVQYLQRLFLEPPSTLVSSDGTNQNGMDVDGEQEEEEDAATAAAAVEKRLMAQRTWALDQMLHVARNGGVVKDEEIVRGLVEFLAVVGWFDIQKESDKGARSYVATPALSAAQRSAARSRFFSILTALLSVNTTPSAPTAAATTPAVSLVGGSIWLSRAFATLENLAKDTKHFSLAESTDVDEDDEDEDEVEELKKRSKEMYELLAKGAGKKEKVSKEEEERRKVARALIEGVLLVEWDEKAEASEVLEQLCDALPLLFPALLKAYKSEDDALIDEEDGELPEPTTVLISLLLALLQRPSAFVKAVAAEVVEGFADEMGEQAVGLLLETMAPAPEEGDAADDEEAAEEEVSVAGEKKGKKAAVEAVEESDEEDDGESDSDDDEVDEKFREELLAALEAGGLAPLNEETGAGDDDDSEEEEELLDDDAMMELDDNLAAIFRANGGGRKTKKRDRTDDMHYRLRLLDLLEVLARKRPSSPLLIPTFVPLLNIARSTAPLEAELRLKASKLVRYLVQPRKPTDSIVPASPDSALEALEELHALAQGVEIAEHAPLCAQTAIALVKAALASPAADASTSSTVSTLFSNSFEQYLSTKNAKTKAQPLLTVEFCKRVPTVAWGSFDRIVQLAKGEVEGDKKATVNAFRRMQAFEVSHTLLVSYANLKTPESKAAVVSEILAYRAALHDALSTSLTSTPSAATFDAARLKQLVKNALAAARLTVQLSSQSEAAKSWSVAQWIELLDAAKNNERFKGAVAVQTLIKQLVSVLGGSVAGDEGANKKQKKDKKRKATDDAVESKGKKAKAVEAEVADENEGANEVEVEVEMDEDDVPSKSTSETKGTPSKKEKKDKKKRRRSEGKA